MNTQLSEFYAINPATITMPDLTALNRLAVSNNGFVFDPVNGDSFTVNACGLTVLQSLKDGQSLNEILDRLCLEYRVDTQKAERDVLDFIAQLRKYYK